MEEKIDAESRLAFTPEDKLHREIEKLTEEVRVLRHPFSQPAAWIASIALFLTVVGNIGQAFTYNSVNLIAKADLAESQLKKNKVDAEREKVKTEVESLQNRLTSIGAGISSAQQKTNCEQLKNILTNCEELKKTLTDIGQSISAAQDSTQKTAENLGKSEAQNTQASSINDEKPDRLKNAKAKESEGFQNLISGNYDAASSAFQAAEDAYPSYHNVYELAQILKKNQSKMSDPATKKQVFQTIVKQFPYGAPPDLWRQVVEIAGQ